ncbi:MAG: hypothetical protein QG577_2782 [Thermodesulfobacteriota bacterium]|nr:hypothetical protein [Thermodesulfobacteriota bacterium]
MSRESGSVQAQSNRGWIVAMGIGLIILGIIGLGMTFALTTVSILFYGIMLIVGAMGQFVDAAKRRGFKDVLYHILIALLYLFAGIVIVTNPIQAELILTLIVAAILLSVGLVRMVMAIGMRQSGSWFLQFLSGAVSAVLGVMIMVQWPVSGLWVIGLFISVELLVNGWSYIFLGFSPENK